MPEFVLSQNQSDDLKFVNLPPGFTLTQTAQGEPQLHYRANTVYGCVLTALVAVIFVLAILDVLRNFYLAPVVLALGIGLFFIRRLTMDRRVYTWHADRLVFQNFSVLGLRRTLTIPKADLTAVRLLYETTPSTEGDVNESWKLVLSWAKSYSLSVFDVWTNRETVEWLMTRLVTWSELPLQWENSVTGEKRYERAAAATNTPSAPAKPVVTTIQGNQLLRWGLACFLFISAGFSLIDQSLGSDTLFVSSLMLLIGVLLVTNLIDFGVLDQRFRQEGVTTQGVITQLWIEYAANSVGDQYYLAYSFPDGVETKAKVKAEIYHRLRVGDAITVRYLATEPTISQVGWP